MSATAVRTIPTSFLADLGGQTSDNLTLAANIANERCMAAPRGSRSATLWMNRREACVRVINDRGLFVRVIDEHSGYVLMTRDEVKRLEEWRATRRG